MDEETLLNSTPKDECEAPEAKENDSYSFILTGSDKKNYEFTIIFATSKILLQAREINDISDYIYKTNFSLEELYKLNRFFMLYENLDDIFKFFTEIKDKDMTLKLENNNIIVNLKCKIMRTEQNIEFILLRQEVKIEDIARNLCQKVKEIDYLKKEIDNIYDLFLGFKNSEINVYYEEMKKNSDILNSKEEFVQILKGIRKSFEFKIKNIILLYKASKDGDSSSAFHQKCDEKSFTITIVKTIKNKRFGGFTVCSWNSNSSYYSDRYAFIFSLDNKENYYINNYSGENAIYCNSSYGPTFGSGHDFYISNGCKSNSNSYDGTQSAYFTKNKQYALAGESSFTVNDYEVFQLEIL